MLHSFTLVSGPVSLKITCDIGDILQDHPLRCVMTLKPEMDAPVTIDTEWTGPTPCVQRVSKYHSNAIVLPVSVVAPFKEIHVGESYTCVVSIKSRSKYHISSKQEETRFKAG